MDIVSLLTLVGILAAIVSSATDWAKNLLAASSFDDSWSQEAHAALVQAFALIVGALVAFIAQLDVVHVILPASTLPLEACYILSGFALALPADVLKTVLQWVKAARDAKERQSTSSSSTSTSVKIDAQTETVTTPEGLADPSTSAYTAPGYVPSNINSRPHR